MPRKPARQAADRPTPGSSRRWAWALALLGCSALAIRLIYLFELRDSVFFSLLIGDSRQFDILARRIAAGDWTGSDVFYQAQFYPYFLALVYRIAGYDTFGVRVVQALLGALSCVILTMAGRRFFDARAGLIAGALLAVYPPAIFFDGVIHKSSPDLLLVTLLLLALGACLDRPSGRWLIVAGVTLGALAWNRENARVLYPVIAGWLLLRDTAVPLQQRVTWLAIFTAGIAAVLLPVALRNARTTGELVLTTSQFGPNFYIGNRLGAHGGYEPLVAGRGNAQFEREDAIRLAEAASGRPLTAGEVSDYWWQRTVGDIRQAPGSWIRLLARKTWLTFASREPIDTESLEAYRDSSVLLRALRFFDFGIVMALAVFGAWMTRDRWRRLSVLYATFAVMAASVIIFFVFARYRFPLVPVALLFAGAGLASAVGRPRGSRAWLPGAIAAAATVLLLHIPVQTSSDETYVNYGSELLREGRPAEAVPLLREAVRQDPSHGDARLSLALALQKTGQAQAAIDEFNTAARLDPRSSKAPAGVAITLHQQGRVQEAIPFYEDAIRLAPESIEALSNLGLALIELGRPAEAIVPLERAVALQPQDPRVRINLVQAEYALAQALAADGDAAGAILHMERALSAARAGGAAPEAARIEEALRLLRRGG